jgi:hypothetical protein
MCGFMDSPLFGKTSATAYTQYWPVNSPIVVNTNAVVQRLTLTLIFDSYWQGSPDVSQQTYQVYEVTDSILTYLAHYSNQSTPYGPFLGEVQRTVSPATLAQNRLDNDDDNSANNITDSVNIDLDLDLAQRLLDAAMDTVGSNENNYGFFSKFRRNFKGLAIVGANNDKIVGFDPNDAKCRMTLHYKIDTVDYKLGFQLNSPGASGNIPEYVSYTELKTDRSGTPLAGLPSKYIEFEPSDGRRYLQSGTGLAIKLDLSEVLDHFKNIPIKAFSAAELQIETDEQPEQLDIATTSFTLRALKPNNRPIFAVKGGVDGAGDPVSVIDVELASKHAVVPQSTRLEPMNDSGTGPFTLRRSSNGSGTAVFAGYLTNFLQKETSLTEADFLRYFALIPQTPDIGKTVNGFYFPADKIKLKIYYTTPSLEE